MRLYHPLLGREIDVPEPAAEVLADSGWEPAPEPDQIPGHEPEPVVYAPVEPTTPKSRRKSTDD